MAFEHYPRWYKRDTMPLCTLDRSFRILEKFQEDEYVPEPRVYDEV
jgi:hypothetical protein